MSIRIIVLLTLLASLCSAGNIIQDPSFENGIWAAWSSSGSDLDANWEYFHTGLTSIGGYCISSDCMDQSTGSYIQQTLNTIAGQFYTLSFWVTENSGPTSELAVYWDGNLVQDILNPNNYGGNEGWVQLSFSNLLATSTSTVLQVNLRQDPAGIFVDDFFADVSDPVATPEPATIAFSALGLAALVFARRSRR